MHLYTFTMFCILIKPSHYSGSWLLSRKNQKFRTIFLHILRGSILFVIYDSYTITHNVWLIHFLASRLTRRQRRKIIASNPRLIQTRSPRGWRIFLIILPTGTQLLKFLEKIDNFEKKVLFLGPSASFMFL